MLLILINIILIFCLFIMLWQSFYILLYLLLILQEVIVFLHQFLIVYLCLLSLLLQLQRTFLLELSLWIFIFQVLFLSLQVVNFWYKLFVLTHDSFVVSLMQLNIFLEFFFKSLDSRLKMRSFLDELSLLVNPFHLPLTFLLNILPVKFNNLRLESFVILNKIMNTWM